MALNGYDKNIEVMTRKQIILVLGGMIALCSCDGMSKGGGSSQGEVEEMEFIRPVKEQQSVDSTAFSEESHGTPITGYQGYPDDDLVKESTDDDIVNFEGEADLDYHDGGGDDYSYDY